MDENRQSHEPGQAMGSQPKQKVKAVSGMAAVHQSMAAVFTGDERNRHAARHLLLRAGVWFPLDFYRRWPVAYPWMVRDNQLSKGGALAGKVSLGTAHRELGWERQDNAPVGNLKNGLPVAWAEAKPFGKKPLASDRTWWACHVGEGHATDPLTNSFVPGLVWLPEAIGKLTDLKSGSVDHPDEPGWLFREEVRAISQALYRDTQVNRALADVVEKLWEARENADAHQPFAGDRFAEYLPRVNWFTSGESLMRKLAQQTLNVDNAARHLLDGGDRDHPAIANLTPKGYRDTLPDANPSAWANLVGHLEPFADQARQILSQPSPVAPVIKSKKKPGAGVSGKGGLHTVTTSSGSLQFKARSRAACHAVREVLAHGVPPATVKAVLGAKLASVDGQHNGDGLRQELAVAGVKGAESRWFVDSATFVDGRTWVVNSHYWNAADEPLIRDVCALTDGAVAYTLERVATTSPSP